MTHIVFQTKDLTKYYGRLKVVDAINITAYEGEVFGFLGPNGAGKTTTLGMALGLVHPSSGEVTVLGERVTPNHIHALRGVGALLGSPALVPYLSVWDNLDLAARLNPGVDKKRIAEVIEIVGLKDATRRRVGKFSTGMKQRAGLAMALLHRPRFVILDEPTNGLDPAGMREMRQLIHSLIETGVTVLLSSHLLNEVQQICDRIAVLNKGRVVAQGRVDELLSGQRPSVRLVVPFPDETARLLQAMPGVEEVQVNGGGAVIVSGVDSSHVMGFLLQHDIIPSEVTSQKTDLEALFMDVTHRD